MIGLHAEAGQTNTCSVSSPICREYFSLCVSLPVVNKNGLNVFSANPRVAGKEGAILSDGSHPLVKVSRHHQDGGDGVPPSANFQ